MNLVAMADENLKKFGEYPSLIFEGATFTNRRILDDANGLSRALQTLGVRTGDRVAVMLPNGPEVLIAYQGILRCGAVIVPLIPLLFGRELAHILADCEATAMITSLDILQKNEPGLRAIKALRHVILLDDDVPAGTLSFRSLIGSCSEGPALPAAREEDLAVILYTAGTTANPKGVMLTHRNLYANAVNAAISHGTQRADITLVALPLSHSFGITTMNKAYRYGNLHVLMRRFNAEEAFQLIERYGVTDLPGVPAMFMAMLNSPAAGGYDLSSWKRCLSGAAPFPLASLLQFQEKFGCTVFEAYGLSEASPAVSTNYHDRPTKPGSIGQPIPEVEVRIVDGEGRDVAPGDIGELIVKGPSVSAGYYRLPEETAKTFRNGWLFTGDMARMDGDGYLYLMERKKDLIIRGGFNVYPRDIEEVLHQHPAVRDAVAIGVPDPVLGEEIKVYLVLKEGVTATPEEILTFGRERLAKYKWPKFIEFSEGLPRNPMGKILRRELRRQNETAP